jgi:hypothetical protein
MRPIHLLANMRHPFRGCACVRQGSPRNLHHSRTVQNLHCPRTLGTRTTVTDLRATKVVNSTFGKQVQNLRSVRMVFDDIQKDQISALAMMGGFMMIVIPSSTKEERAKLLDRMLAGVNKSSVRAYGWAWGLQSTGTPPKSLTFEAATIQ